MTTFLEEIQQWSKLNRDLACLTYLAEHVNQILDGDVKPRGLEKAIRGGVNVEDWEDTLVQLLELQASKKAKMTELERREVDCGEKKRTSRKRTADASAKRRGKSKPRRNAVHDCE